MRRALLALPFAAIILAAATSTAAAAPNSAATARTSTTGTATATTASAKAATPAISITDLTTCSSTYFDGDFRLGPASLPVLGIVGFELLGYHRTGDLTEQQLLATYYDPTGNGGSGGWIYPPDNGYVIGADGQPIETHLTLRPGQDIDRYGSEYGSFLAPEWLSYAARAIPPQSLDSNPASACNYHDYRVVKPFAVDAGPIAAWFGQPGGGLQYQLDASLVPGAPTPINVMWLVTNGYLARLN